MNLDNGNRNRTNGMTRIEVSKYCSESIRHVCENRFQNHTQESLAELIGVSRNSVNGWANGGRMSTENLDEVLDKLHITFFDFMMFSPSFRTENNISNPEEKDKLIEELKSQMLALTSEMACRDSELEACKEALSDEKKANEELLKAERNNSMELNAFALTIDICVCAICIYAFELWSYGTLRLLIASSLFAATVIGQSLFFRSKTGQPIKNSFANVMVGTTIANLIIAMIFEMMYGGLTFILPLLAALLSAIAVLVVLMSLINRKFFKENQNLPVL